MTTTSPNAILAIVKGIPKVLGDTASVEQGLDSINLLDPRGFSCDSYDIQLPNMKGGVVWADSPITDGRALISGALGNVTETMRLQLTAGTLIQMAAMLSKLARFKQDCNDFWDTSNQIDPVYIKHQIEGEPGPRFALLYNIEIHVESPITPGSPNREVTLSIEREFGWRGIAPGATPMEWTDYFLGRAFNVNSSDLTSTNSLASASPLQNKSEHSNSACTTLSTNNGILIPAASIPGDLPALTTLYMTQGNSRLYFWAGRKTINPTSNSITGAGTVAPNAIMNAAGGTLGTNATLANDTGSVKAPGAANAQRVEISFGTATNSLRLTFDDSGNLKKQNRFIGKWMVFMRCRLTAGSSTDVTMYLRYGPDVNTNSDGIQLPNANPQVIAGTGNSTAWGLSYMGVMSIPIIGDAKATVGQGGAVGSTGISPTIVDLDIALFAARTAGAGVLYICDLILIPYDECAFTIKNLDSSPNTPLLVDNTGYMNHGAPGVYHHNAGAPAKMTSYAGNEIYLSPNVANYLYFICADSSLQSYATDTFNMTVNIVPRWAGFRDR